jgi:putative effector of murein hydrolase
MWVVRYLLPAVVVVAGLVVLIAGPDSAKLEGGAAMVGAGLAIGLLNALHRFGVSGDADRDAEEAARRHFDATGRWPD